VTNGNSGSFQQNIESMTVRRGLRKCSLRWSLVKIIEACANENPLQSTLCDAGLGMPSDLCTSYKYLIDLTKTANRGIKMINITFAAIEKLNMLLNLPYMDWMQDWDIQLADSNRIQEFCDAYERENLDSNEKQALMALIIASYNNYLEERGNEMVLWDKIAALLRRDLDLHKPTLLYWSCDNSEEITGEFAVTPSIKALLS
jgi:hypothetical protein